MKYIRSNFERKPSTELSTIGTILTNNMNFRAFSVLTALLRTFKVSGKSTILHHHLTQVSSQTNQYQTNESSRYFRFTQLAPWSVPRLTH
jgi:hypothetical protein